MVPIGQSDISLSVLPSMARGAAYCIGSQIGRQLIRGILGTILGGR